MALQPTELRCHSRLRSRTLPPMDTLRDQARTIIFEAETPAGRAFDVVLIICILVSVVAVFLDTVPPINAAYGELLYVVEWCFTILFTIEYAARLWCIEHPARYARSFYGVVDLLGILPTYLSIFFVGAQYLLVIRILRVLRVFRVLRLLRYVREADILFEAVRGSRRKILVFLVLVLSVVVIAGSVMYLVEGPEHGFTSIPASMYWAVVTVTTVGYGDISPETPLGRFIASAVMILGYAIIAVPTGIFSVQLTEAMRRRQNTRSCPSCAADGHAGEASFCWRCGSKLHKD
jgi:voltage-gated potassium channel